MRIKLNTWKINIWKNFSYVPEVLNVHLNEIYEKLTTTKENKLKFEKIFLKITFSLEKVHFSLLGKKIFRKKVDFFYVRSHERSELLVHILAEDFVLMFKVGCFCVWEEKSRFRFAGNIARSISCANTLVSFWEDGGTVASNAMVEKSPESSPRWLGSSALSIITLVLLYSFSNF